MISENVDAVMDLLGRDWDASLLSLLSQLSVAAEAAPSEAVGETQAGPLEEHRAASATALPLQRHTSLSPCWGRGASSLSASQMTTALPMFLTRACGAVGVFLLIFSYIKLPLHLTFMLIF